MRWADNGSASPQPTAQDPRVPVPSAIQTVDGGHRCCAIASRVVVSMIVRFPLLLVRFGVLRAKMVRRVVGEFGGDVADEAADWAPALQTRTGAH